MVLFGVAAAHNQVTISTISDQPLVLDQDSDYLVQDIVATDFRDTPALTLTGRIRSLLMHNCTLGRVRGANGRAAAVLAEDATIGSITAVDCRFTDAMDQLVSLKDGRFGAVTFRNCTFKTSTEFLAQIYAESPWRSGPPLTEFYNIERLELIDNNFENTTVVIHPSVKKVIIRGEIPGLKIEDDKSTQVLHIEAPDPTRATALLD